MNKNDDYILLLSKQFSGEIAPAELDVLNEWLAQSPENERLAAELRLIWEKTGGYGKSFSPDLDAAFRQVQAKIKIAEQPRAKVVPLGQRLMRAAAVLLFLLAAVWGYREFSAPPLTKILAENEKRLVELPDGSHVWLRKGSEMEFPSKFSDSERRVTLSGEAYFEVNHDPSQPFFVELPNDDVVKVLGTEFGVRSSENQTDVFVRSGKVFFSPKMQPKGVVLTARQKATYNRDATQLTVDENATLNELAWQTGGLEFVRTPMEKVIGDLERHFNVKISLQNSAMRGCTHTSPLTTQPLEKVLESLALTYQFRVASPAPGQYQLLGGVCQ